MKKIRTSLKRPCHICRAPGAVEGEIEVSRMGDDGAFHTETVGYCEKHLVGERVSGLRLYSDERVSIGQCRVCGEAFADGAFIAPPAKEVCLSCYYSGAVHAERPRIATLIRRLQEAAPTADVGVWHTGGGCFGLAVEWKERAGRLLFGTGVESEASLPEEGEAFIVGRYETEEDFGSEGTYTDNVSDDDFVRLAAEEEARA
jgi:hypothetical protein